MWVLARLSLRNRGLTVLLAVFVIGFGAIVIPGLRQQLYPDLDLPAAYVIADHPGAAPDFIDRQVVAPIVAGIQDLPGLQGTTSTSVEGSSTIQVNLDYGTSLDETVAKLNAALEAVAPQLPAGTRHAVFSGSSSNMPAVVLAAGSSADERVFADRLTSMVVPEIQKIEGVRQAEVTGARAREVVITPNLAKLTAAGADVTSIVEALRGNGVATPAGSVAVGKQSLTVQVGAPLITVAQIRDLYLTPSAPPTQSQPPSSPGPSSPPRKSSQSAPPRKSSQSAPPNRSTAPGRSATPRPPAPGGRERITAIRLGDVADVSPQLAPVTSITRANGKRSLGISVRVAPDGNAVSISDAIRARLPRLRAALGGDAQLTTIYDQAPYVKRSISSLVHEGVLGLAFAVVVILVFLLSVRSTLVTAVSIPLSVIIALIELWVWDYSLNILTLGALTIALGRVVDDSIVVLENIKRHLDGGDERYAAVTSGVREVAGAVTASTITTVAVFAPIGLVGGLIGELFSSFAITVAAALLASLLVSLTVIPVLAYWFLRPARGGAGRRHRTQEQRERGTLPQRAYDPVLRFAIRRRLTTVAVGVLILLGTGALAGGLKTNFFDQSGQNSLTITQKLPAGTSIATTDAAARQVERIIAGMPEIKTYQVTIGGGGANGDAAINCNQATFALTVRDGADATAVQDEMRTSLAALSSAGDLKVSTGSSSGFSSDQLQVIVEAQDDATLATATDRMRQAVASVDGVVEVGSDLATTVPRVMVDLDRRIAGEYGFTDATVGEAVTAALRGSQLGRVTIDGTQQILMMRLGAAPASIDQIKALPLASAAGTVTLGQVAKVRQTNGPVQIVRVNGARSATVTGTVTDSNVGQATADLTAKLKTVSLPDGATYHIGGVSSDQSEAFTNLALAMLAAIAIVYTVMAATFRSLAQPLVLLISVPFAATGAIGLLLATDTALGVPALIGMLMLVGIVVTNAIVLLDLINAYRQSGKGIEEAVLEGGRQRLRPILMTAIATVFALLPMALGIEGGDGGGGFISRPLAVVVIGGLLSSTVLTLVLVPTLYTMIERRTERRTERRSARHPARAAADATAKESMAAALAATTVSDSWNGFEAGAPQPADANHDGSAKKDAPGSA